MSASDLPRLDFRLPFTRAQAVAAGLTLNMLRSTRFRRIYRDVYVHEIARAHPLTRPRAALLLHPPSAFASHTTAAQVYGVPVPALGAEHVSVFTAADRRRRAGLVNHVVPPDVAVRVSEGLRVSAPERMFVELATLLALVDLVVVGDALVRQGLASPASLVQACAAYRGRGALLARQAAGLVRARVDSPMETRLRLLIVLAGLPEPVVNLELRAEDGRVRYRLDLSYPKLKVAVEYDGRQHREQRQAEWDLARREWFDHQGWLLVPVVATGIHRRPEQSLDRIVTALRSRGCKDLPPRPAEAWRPHFPVAA